MKRISMPTLIPLPPSPLNMEKGNFPSPYLRERVRDARVRVGKFGQSTVEFIVMLTLLTALGFLLARIWPSLMSVQTNVAAKIGRD